MSSLYLHPVPIRPAKAHVLRTHRRLPRLTGGLWAIGCYEPPALLVGVLVVGRPNARLSDYGGNLQVLRCAVETDKRNACSMLYGAAARVAKAMGADNLWTYIHDDETGVSLKAAGWIRDKLTRGGEWSRPLRSRAPMPEPGPKQRWFAPWSAELGKSARGAGR